MASVTPAGHAAGHSQAGTVEAQQATPEQMAEIRRLAQVIARLFYEDGHILVMDQLVSIAAIPAEVLARRIGMQTRDLTSLATKLVQDRMISVHRNQETREGPFQRPITRTYFYMDYKHFLDVTKWRMMAMRRHIDTKLRNGLDNKGYVCPRCRHSYSTLEVAHLLDLTRNMFVCEVPGCGTELVDNEDAEDVRNSKDTLTRFNEQLSVVQRSLRSVEGVALPSLDIHAWLAKNSTSPPWQHEMVRNDAALAPGSVSTPAPKAPAVRIEMEHDVAHEEVEKEKLRTLEEERQRAQNTLPSWHLASTVSGERTGLGASESLRRANASSNEWDDVKEVVQDMGTAQDDEDVDYYARYASQAQEAAVNAKTSTKRENDGSMGTVDVDDTNGLMSKRPRYDDGDKDTQRTENHVPINESRPNRETDDVGDDDEDEMDDMEDVI
jgi:hypothetical protein